MLEQLGKFYSVTSTFKCKDSTAAVLVWIFTLVKAQRWSKCSEKLSSKEHFSAGGFFSSFILAIIAQHGKVNF